MYIYVYIYIYIYVYINIYIYIYKSQDLKETQQTLAIKIQTTLKI